ncbi:hypothetical protein GCK72_017262 [Caenorhabditis remanei]|uniref:T20D4.11-like domain-containing protein n=1 Tax=Caenorhabditis remanei TaxID=31234 RepID=A0A6A5G7L4_CAERE|nr:hypothetical protein GCK72_017262 [Caenorhabditis remanei]KAF1750711.1 hypothetical protein GCK72_017262 [Caenorhabditis remanei]
MACGCAVQLVCWICLFFCIILFVGFIMTVWEATTSNSDFCSRAQLLTGVDCAKKTRRLEDSLMKINKTTRFLRPPSEYTEVVADCEKAESCFTKITCEDGHDFVADVMDTFPACKFYRYYTGDFMECAEKLMSLAPNTTCLNALFNAKHVIRFNRCKQWLNIQPCIYDAILNECNFDGNSTQLVTDYAETARDFYRSMNCEPKPQRIDTNDIDYEIIGLVGQ